MAYLFDMFNLFVLWLPLITVINWFIIIVRIDKFIFQKKKYGFYYGLYNLKVILNYFDVISNEFGSYKNEEDPKLHVIQAIALMYCLRNGGTLIHVVTHFLHWSKRKSNYFKCMYQYNIDFICRILIVLNMHPILATGR